jgi:predicted nucleotidyltransferase
MIYIMNASLKNTEGDCLTEPIQGIIIPIMSTNKVNLSDALFSKVQQQILGLLYGQPDSTFHTNEIIRLAKSGTGAVQRELTKLTAANLITVKQVGNQKRYQANRATPLFSELRSIVIKTFGLSDIIRDSLELCTQKIQLAFIYGSIAKQEDTASSDIDLMLISDDLTYAEVFDLLENAEMKLGRKINPTFYSQAEWRRKYNEGNNFIIQLSQQPKIFLIGTENEFTKFK